MAMMIVSPEERCFSSVAA